MKNIVIYFSRSGNNYVDGNICDLPVGNTKVIAQRIQEITGVDAFEIIPVKAYSTDYTTCTEEAKQELNEQARPAYQGDINLAPYDTIYLGYPIWWSTFPMCVCTFIEHHNGLAGKTIVPFATHEGSGMGSSIGDLKRLCPQAKICQGVAIKGSTVAKAKVDGIVHPKF